MVLFILTRAGYADMERLIAGPVVPVWINAGVLDSDEAAALRGSGVDLTRFSHPVDSTDESQIAQAIETIRLHHPGERIWMEVAPDAGS